MDRRGRRRFLLVMCGLTGSALWSGCDGPLTSVQRRLSAPSPERPGPAQVGVLHLSASPDPPVVIGLRQGLSELGYVEGRDVVLEIRSGQGRPESAATAARELVSARVQVLVTAGTVATQAAREAADGLPIVFTQVGDPIAAGFVQSLARPGGSLTGFSHLLPATSGKRLQLLREMVPGAQVVLALYDPANPTSAAAADVARASGSQLGVALREEHVRSREEVEAALRQVDRSRIDAILVLPDSLVVNAGDQIIETARRERLPVMFHEDTWVRQGGLASYGASFSDLARQAASYVDRILRGTRPSDLPVQQASRFDLVINLRTAQALGLTIPQAVQLQVTEVIQ